MVSTLRHYYMQTRFSFIAYPNPLPLMGRVGFRENSILKALQRQTNEMESQYVQS